MKISRSKQKRLSAGLPTITQNLLSDHEANLSLHPRPSILQNRRKSNEDLSLPSDADSSPHKSIIPEFESPMKQIKDQASARLESEAAKKSSLKSELMQRLSEVFIKPSFKESTSTNTGSGFKELKEFKGVDDSLVNLESADEEESKKSNFCRSGNSGIISLVLEQSNLIGKDKKLKKMLMKKMMQAVWTDWFFIVFRTGSDAFALYGRKNSCLVKVAGDESFRNKVETKHVLRCFKYDWINRRFRDTSNFVNSDAVVIYS